MKNKPYIYQNSVFKNPIYLSEKTFAKQFCELMDSICVISQLNGLKILVFQIKSNQLGVWIESKDRKTVYTRFFIETKSVINNNNNSIHSIEIDCPDYLETTTTDPLEMLSVLEHIKQVILEPQS